MSQWVLNNNGKVLPYQTLGRITKPKISDYVEVKKRAYFDKRITSLLETLIEPPTLETPEVTLYYEDEENSSHEMLEADSFKDHDNFLNAEVLLSQDEEHLQAARALKRSLDSAGNSKGNSYSNPMLDTRNYDVIFLDSAVRQ